MPSMSVSQNTNFRFAKYRFAIYRFAIYRFAKYHFAIYCRKILFCKIPFRKIPFRNLPFRKIPFRNLSFRFTKYRKPLIDGCNIQSLIDLKLLGVTIDNKMTFSTHIRDVCKKTSMKIRARLRLRNVIPVDAKLQLYKAATPSPYVLSYCKALL